MHTPKACIGDVGALAASETTASPGNEGLDTKRANDFGPAA